MSDSGHDGQSATTRISDEDLAGLLCMICSGMILLLGRAKFDRDSLATDLRMAVMYLQARLPEVDASEAEPADESPPLEVE